VDFETDMSPNSFHHAVGGRRDIMLKLFGGLFTPGDPLIALARSGDFRTFARSFLSSQVFVVSSPVARSLAPAEVTAEALSEEVDEAPRAATDASGIDAFTYGPAGEEVLPVFSSEAAAQAFVQAYVELANRVIPFITASLEGAGLVPLLAGRRIGVVLNPLTENEYELPRELVAELRSSR
jgi:hypothetical protein